MNVSKGNIIFTFKILIFFGQLKILIWTDILKDWRMFLFRRMSPRRKLPKNSCFLRNRKLSFLFSFFFFFLHFSCLLVFCSPHFRSHFACSSDDFRGRRICLGHGRTCVIVWRQLRSYDFLVCVRNDICSKDWTHHVIK